MIIKMDILAYKDAIQIFNHLLIFVLRKTDKKIIKEGIIKITEKITKISGDVGPIGVLRSIIFSNFLGVIN